MAEQLHHLRNGAGPLGRHQSEALLGEGVVQTDGEVAIALVEESAETLHHTYGADGDALGAPCQAVVGGHQCECLQDVAYIVERLAHAHEHHVRKALALGDGEHLVQYLSRGQVGREALLAGHAEEAVHLASHL